MNIFGLKEHFASRDRVNKELIDFAKEYYKFSKIKTDFLEIEENLKITLRLDRVLFERFYSSYDQGMEIDEYQIPMRYLETEDWKGLIVKEREEYKQQAKELALKHEEARKILALAEEKRVYARLKRKFEKEK